MSKKGGQLQNLLGGFIMYWIIGSALLLASNIITYNLTHTKAFNKGLNSGASIKMFKEQMKEEGDEYYV